MAAVASEPRAPTTVFRCLQRNVVLDALAARPGWVETSDESDWDLMWGDVQWVRENLERLHLEDHQRVCHFPNHYELTRKDLLVKNVKRMRKQLERADQWAEASKFDFVPTSFSLPADYSLFVEEFKKHPGSTWIMKPSGRSQGKGIFLANKLSQIALWRSGGVAAAAGGGGGGGGGGSSPFPSGSSGATPGGAAAATAGGGVEQYVAQRYIDRPYTIGRKKFDCRIYVLVTSFLPLEVWLYRSGFARFSGARYSTAREDQDNLFIHLTNVAIQRTKEGYDEAQGCKWSLRRLKLFMASKHGLPVVEKLFGDIQDVILRSLQAVQKTVIHDRHCFELYGYDILFDEALKPWLLEVNASPSMSADTDEDYRLKRALIDDVLSVLDLEGARSGREARIGGFDLIWDNGPVDLDLPPGVLSPLGCLNHRERDMMHLVHPKRRAAAAAAVAAAAAAEAASLAAAAAAVMSHRPDPGALRIPPTVPSSSALLTSPIVPSSDPPTSSAPSAASSRSSSPTPSSQAALREADAAAAAVAAAVAALSAHPTLNTASSSFPSSSSSSSSSSATPAAPASGSRPGLFAGPGRALAGLATRPGAGDGGSTPSSAPSSPSTSHPGSVSRGESGPASPVWMSAPRGPTTSSAPPRGSPFANPGRVPSTASSPLAWSEHERGDWGGRELGERMEDGRSRRRLPPGREDAPGDLVLSHRDSRDSRDDGEDGDEHVGGSRPSTGSAGRGETGVAIAEGRRARGAGLGVREGVALVGGLTAGGSLELGMSWTSHSARGHSSSTSSSGGGGGAGAGSPFARVPPLTSPAAYGGANVHAHGPSPYLPPTSTLRSPAPSPLAASAAPGGFGPSSGRRPGKSTGAPRPRP